MDVTLAMDTTKQDALKRKREAEEPQKKKRSRKSQGGADEDGDDTIMSVSAAEPAVETAVPAVTVVAPVPVEESHTMEVQEITKKKKRSRKSKGGAGDIADVATTTISVTTPVPKPEDPVSEAPVQKAAAITITTPAAVAVTSAAPDAAAQVPEQSTQQAKKRKKSRKNKGAATEDTNVATTAVTVTTPPPPTATPIVPESVAQMAKESVVEEQKKKKKRSRKNKSGAGENGDDTVMSIDVATHVAQEQAVEEPVQEGNKKNIAGNAENVVADGAGTTTMSLAVATPSRTAQAPLVKEPKQEKSSVDSVQQQAGTPVSDSKKRKGKTGTQRRLAKSHSVSDNEDVSGFLEPYGSEDVEMVDAPVQKTKEGGQKQKEPVTEAVVKADVAAASQSALTTADVGPASIATPKAGRRQSRKKKQGQDEAEQKGQPQAASNDKTLVAPAADEKKAMSTAKKHKTKSKARWTVSEPIGGWFLSQDPTFSPDEKSLFLANSQALQIYSTATSLLSRSLPISASSGRLSAYALSASNPDQLYIATASGLISLWDWNTGAKSARWDIGNRIRQLISVTRPEISHDLLYCHEVTDSQSHIINVHSLRTGAEASQSELKEILKTKSAVTSVQVLLEGKVILVSTQNTIMIGRPVKQRYTSLKDLAYTWRQFQIPKRVTTLHGYIRPNPTKSADNNPRVIIDLAVGDEEGVIHVFEDVLTTFVQLERDLKEAGQNGEISAESLKPKLLHWHRDAVGSVKWSQDGNYVISGGKETVLVIWQLATGNHQTLPHLTSAIENIVVSPHGASYALSLANNSVVVLSTSELEPKTNIVGLQSRRVDFEQLPQNSSTQDYPYEVFRRIPMAVNPQDPNRVIMSVPSSQPRHDRSNLEASEPYIQTYDVAASLHVSRQAMTRNNATDFNTGPEKTKISEPSVKHLQFSHDGQWLATIDEWIPPRGDMGYLDEGIPEFNEEERSFRREVYLKFWRWDKEAELWALDARIDSPHALNNVGAAARVLDLVSEPTSAGFATVGEDGCVRIWEPKTRLRNGVTVRGAEEKGSGLVTWSLHRSIELGSRLDVLNVDSEFPLSSSRNACLAFSADGSVLAAGISREAESDPGVIHIISTENGIIRRSITELDVRGLACLGLTDRYLISVGDSIVVWDLVIDELVFCTPLDSPGLTRASRSSMVNLAINTDDGTFAVSCPVFEEYREKAPQGVKRFKKPTTRVFVLDPKRPEAFWSTVVGEIVLALLPQRRERGFVALDATSSIRFITPKASSLQITARPQQNGELQPPVSAVVEQDEDEMDVDDEDTVRRMGGLLGSVPGLQKVIEDSENDKPVVRTEQLQEIFENGQGLPPVRDLFNAVVGLYARKSRAGEQ
ncbi:WD40 repeat-like protein [Delitschia confertaspora ATCC 74209]|uniref:WD40 repeat-like protein n=1 Tax=Delitschia confertaspora ATCC 74209 TaxID=1513339 RepID=A0A9P4JQN7_9PLEO|nr:WD40 repeat-like protein [Delitschia confertaspora ATCC 74209]